MIENRAVRIVLAGVDAKIMAKMAQDAGGDRVQAVAMGDMQGARLVKSGQADYYLGTCWSGGGGALAAATATLGANLVGIAGTPGMPVTEKHVAELVGEGRRAFGFAYEQSGVAIPMLVREILAHRSRTAGAPS
ncbi:DUF2620 family protein [Arthrobacter sp. MA-N2]|uniref:DUF2620 family protein n=1 Tax=Arthrobacter sp. MA-N2 TaxID=1101188 RepID=UPI000486988A|nr:DUF2620 family protein [Arthrobacter sp. MA-N2]